jgi:hypothetical protein
MSNDLAAPPEQFEEPARHVTDCANVGAPGPASSAMWRMVDVPSIASNMRFSIASTGAIRSRSVCDVLILALGQRSAYLAA